MYFITTIGIEQDDYTTAHRERTVGYFKHYEEAHLKVIKNAGDMFEGKYYQYACISKIGQGLYQNATPIQWFEKLENGSIALLDTPPRELGEDYHIYVIG